MRQPTDEPTAGATTNAPSLPPLRMATSVPMPPAAAFELFTRDIASWWPLATYSVAGDRAANCRFEGAAGSDLVEEADDGTRHVWGTVLAWEPPGRVAFTWHPGREAASAQQVEVRFTAEPAGCRVELTHSGWEALGEAAQESRERYEGGWQHVLGSAFRQAAKARRQRSRRRRAALAVLPLLLASALSATAAERAIVLEVEVDASVEEVWRSWTTREGIRGFFAPDARIELAPDGAYEMIFDPAAPAGLQGGEGNRVLAVDPPHLLSFSWNAPPSLPEVRSQRTHVTVRLAPLTEARTLVILRHDGWGDGEAWDEAFRYFDHAWGEIVLPRLRQRFGEGPVGWTVAGD